jgi:hypothetical protein
MRLFVVFVRTWKVISIGITVPGAAYDRLQTESGRGNEFKLAMNLVSERLP